MTRLGNHNRKSRAAFAAAAVFLAVAAILFGVLLHFYQDASPSPSPNGTPQETATESAGGRESEFPTVDWDYWKSVNGDVIGWITVPGTDINHPILQAHASDPDYYLHHDIYRNYNPLGALYLDAECEKEAFKVRMPSSSDTACVSVVPSPVSEISRTTAIKLSHQSTPRYSSRHRKRRCATPCASPTS